MSLNEPIADAIQPTEKAAVIDSLWKPLLRARQCDADPNLTSYFEFYHDVCAGLAPHRLAVSVKSHQDLLNLIKLIDVQESKVVLALKIRNATSCNVAEAHGSIDLIARLWLMIRLDPAQTHRPRKLLWPDQLPLAEFLSQRLFKPNTIPPQTVKLPLRFNSFQLKRVAGIKVSWTDSLADHLMVDDDDPDAVTVHIFHHVAVLRHISASSCADIFPRGLLGETLSTISLIIPEDLDCREWFIKEQKAFETNLGRTIDPSVMGLPPASNNLEDYVFWRDRLHYLYNTFERSEPKGLAQLWADRRNKVQWYTFWVALLILFLTILFGLIQSITGILQVALAQKSLDFSISQAQQAQQA